MAKTVTQDRVIAELQEWRQKLDAGKLREWGIFQPKLTSSERYAGRVQTVGATSGDLDIPVESWHPGVGALGFDDTAQGAAYFTTERLFVVANGRRTVREWRWEDLCSVRLLPPAARSLSREVPTVWGVLLRTDPDSNAGEAVASKAPQVGTSVSGGSPLPGKLWLRWLKVEATFFASRGDAVLDQWFAQLPQRALLDERSWPAPPVLG